MELLPRQRGRMARVRDREDGPRARLPPRRDPLHVPGVHRHLHSPLHGPSRTRAHVRQRQRHALTPLERDGQTMAARQLLYEKKYLLTEPVQGSFRLSLQKVGAAPPRRCVGRCRLTRRAPAADIPPLTCAPRSQVSSRQPSSCPTVCRTSRRTMGFKITRAATCRKTWSCTCARVRVCGARRPPGRVPRFSHDHAQGGARDAVRFVVVRSSRHRFPITEENALLASTRVTETSFAAQTSDGLPCNFTQYDCSLRAVTAEDVFYTADIERFTVRRWEWHAQAWEPPC